MAALLLPLVHAFNGKSIKWKSLFTCNLLHRHRAPSHSNIHKITIFFPLDVFILSKFLFVARFSIISILVHSYQQFFPFFIFEDNPFLLLCFPAFGVRITFRHRMAFLFSFSWGHNFTANCLNTLNVLWRMFDLLLFLLLLLLFWSSIEQKYWPIFQIIAKNRSPMRFPIPANGQDFFNTI